MKIKNIVISRSSSQLPIGRFRVSCPPCAQVLEGRARCVTCVTSSEKPSSYCVFGPREKWYGAWRKTAQIRLSEKNNVDNEVAMTISRTCVHRGYRHRGRRRPYLLHTISSGIVLGSFCRSCCHIRHQFRSSVNCHERFYTWNRSAHLQHLPGRPREHPRFQGWGASFT